VDLGILLSKLLPQLVYPLNAGVLLVLAGLILLWRGRGRLAGACLALAIAVLWTFSTAVVADALQAGLERRHAAVTEANAPDADAIVVLGGAVGAPLPPRASPDLSDAADRVLLAAHLYRAGKAPLVVVSGGQTFPTEPPMPEAESIAALLEEWGVPREDIVLEAESRNTHENATRTAALLERRGLRRVLLVTSALHMPRALATFRSEGLDALPAATDFGITSAAQPLVLRILPSAAALERSHRALKEHLGTLVYRWRGWIRS
jgi:uncharacterized SAM-binding protein YcdF (DUF218 family)